MGVYLLRVCCYVGCSAEGALAGGGCGRKLLHIATHTMQARQPLARRVLNAIQSFHCLHSALKICIKGEADRAWVGVRG